MKGVWEARGRSFDLSSSHYPDSSHRWTTIKIFRSSSEDVIEYFTRSFCYYWNNEIGEMKSNTRSSLFVQFSLVRASFFLSLALFTVKYN